MNPTIRDAIEALERLPPERQEELAGYILSLASQDREPEAIPSEQLKSVLEGLEQARRRQLADPNRIAALLGRDDE